ncbi:unnamed protein product, partial [Nesidiocoris tenuis]
MERGKKQEQGRRMEGLKSAVSIETSGSRGHSSRTGSYTFPSHRNWDVWKLNCDDHR